ncbi:MAG: acetolactate synthase small subunit [Terriglobales bacterium]
MVRTFIVYVADHPGVLNRVSSLFRRRGYNIESLTVGHTHKSGISRMTVVVGIDAQGAPLVKANLYKLAEVLHVDDITSLPSLHRELLIAKVAAAENLRPDLMRVLESFHARVLEGATEWLVIEATGAEEVIDRLIEGIQPFGILEMTRTGRVAMTTGNVPSFDIAESAQSANDSISFRNSIVSKALLRNCS